MAEEHSNMQEADDAIKLANKLDPNSTWELEIEWHMKINQYGGVCINDKYMYKCINICICINDKYKYV